MALAMSVDEKKIPQEDKEIQNRKILTPKIRILSSIFALQE